MKKVLSLSVALAGLIVSAGVQGQAQNPPAVPSISQRPTGSSLGTIRGGAADNNIWFGWRVGMPSAAIRGPARSPSR